MMIDFDGNVWIADTGNSRLLRYTPNGSIQQELGPEQVGTPDLKEPLSLAMDAQANLYVADAGSQRVIKLNRDRKMVAEWALPPATSALGYHLAVTANQSLLVTDPEGNRLLEYSLDGKLLRAWGSEGNGAGQFDKPVGIEVFGQKVYVVDTFNNRLQILREK
jgi:DNA-binding beta-propeller fold protein YncE